MRVEQIAFSGDGNACATVDRYYTVYGSGSAGSLKFWSRNARYTQRVKSGFMFNDFSSTLADGLSTREPMPRTRLRLPHLPITPEIVRQHIPRPHFMYEA